MICNKCGVDKPITEYYGRNRVCKKCYDARTIAYVRHRYHNDAEFRIRFIESVKKFQRKKYQNK
jgi:hypothetical protein